MTEKGNVSDGGGDKEVQELVMSLVNRPLWRRGSVMDSYNDCSEYKKI